MDINKIRDDLKKRDKNTREKAIDQLALSPNPDIIADLIQILENDKENSIRRRAALALGRIGNETCADALVKAISDDKDEETRRNAAIALGNFGDERAILPLYEFYKSPRKNTFSDNLDRARVNKVLTELAQKKALGSIDNLVEWYKNKIKKE